MSKQGKKRGRSLCQSADHVYIESSTKTQPLCKLNADKDECPLVMNEQNNKSTLLQVDQQQDCTAGLETTSDSTTKHLKDQQEQNYTSSTVPSTSETTGSTEMQLEENKTQSQEQWNNTDVNWLKEPGHLRDLLLQSDANLKELVYRTQLTEERLRQLVDLQDQHRKHHRQPVEVRQCKDLRELKQMSESLLNSGYSLMNSNDSADEMSDYSSEEDPNMEFVELCVEPDSDDDEYTQWH